MVEFEIWLGKWKNAPSIGSGIQAYKKEQCRKICPVYSFIHSVELKIVWFYYVTVIWWSELKMYSEQVQIEEFALKANIEFKIQSINFGGDRTPYALKNIFITCKAVTLCGGQWIIYYKVNSLEVKSEPAERIIFSNWKKKSHASLVFSHILFVLAKSKWHYLHYCVNS